MDPKDLERTIRIEGGSGSDRPAQLVVLRGEERGKIHELAGVRALIGRGPTNDIVLPAGSVSTMHAALYEEDGEWYIQDLDSTNGTVLAGAKLTPRTPSRLRNGDAVEVGDQMLLFCADAKPVGNLQDLLDIKVDTDKVKAEVDALLSDLPGFDSK